MGKHYPWDHQFDAAVAFYKDHGRWPYRYADDRAEHELGEWCYGQRCRFKRGVLEPDRQRRLEASGFSWAPYDVTWLDHFNTLKRFVENHGRWPEWRAKDESESTLGTWCTKQRANRKHGKVSRMTPERISMLDSIGFSWDAYGDVWLDRFERVRSFVEGHGFWPNRHAEDDVERGLGNWCNVQRKRRRAGKLEQYRADLLLSVGFDFAPGGRWAKKVKRS